MRSVIKTDKLFKVNLKGTYGTGCGVKYHRSYVVAKTMDGAYKKVRDYLDGADIGFSSDRELDSIELVAEDYEYTDVRTRLFQ
jgi:hypothetical protein